MQAAALKSDPSESTDQSPVITTFFDAPFTAVSNSLMKAVYTDPDVNPATRLMIFITRFSTGYLKSEAVLREGFILEATGMSRSSLYRAKNELIESGKITISHTQTGNCVYRLVAELQCLKGASLNQTATGKATERWGSAVGDPPRVTIDTPSNKENKEIQDQQHPIPATPVSNDADFIGHSRSLGPVIDGTLRAGLVARLQRLGVDEFMAHRLVKTSSAEIITRAIDRLKTVSVTNPAGYLVSEITRGGYRDKPDPNKAQREFHREVHEKRLAERLQDDQQAQKSQEQADLLLAQFATLPAELQLDIQQRLQVQAEREGFTRMRGWGEAHPVWKGLLTELLRQNAALALQSG